MNTLIVLLQIAAAVILAPLVSGLIRKIKNNLRMRKGASVFQPYYNLAKLFRKDEVISENTSWIFAAAPYVVLASVLVAFLPLSFMGQASFLNYTGDILLVVFMLSLGRFFLSLAGLDAGSAFGGRVGPSGAAVQSGRD